MIKEKVFSFQRLVLPVPKPYRRIKICYPRRKIKKSLLFLNMLPHHAEFRVPLNRAPTDIDSCRTMQAPICMGSRELIPAQLYHFFGPDQLPFGTVLVPTFIPRANRMGNLQ